MTKEEIEGVTAHARRDKESGHAWRCVCPLCRFARLDSELVSQVEKETAKHTAPHKKTPKETTV